MSPPSIQPGKISLRNFALPKFSNSSLNAGQDDDTVQNADYGQVDELDEVDEAGQDDATEEDITAGDDEGDDGDAGDESDEVEDDHIVYEGETRSIDPSMPTGSDEIVSILIDRIPGKVIRIYYYTIYLSSYVYP